MRTLEHRKVYRCRYASSTAEQQPKQPRRTHSLSAGMLHRRPQRVRWRCASWPSKRWGDSFAH